MGYLNTEIRPMVDADIKMVMEIEKLCFPEPIYKEKDFMYELHDNPVSNVWVIELSNDALNLKSVCGYCDYWNTFDSGTICKIAVHPELQHYGLGSEMMKEILDDCIAKKVETLTLEVRVSNTSAINFYEKFGFKKSHIKKGYYVDGEDAIYMIKEVRKDG